MISEMWGRSKEVISVTVYVLLIVTVIMMMFLFNAS